MKNIIALFLILIPMTLASYYPDLRAPAPELIGEISIYIKSQEEGYLVHHRISQEFFTNSTEVEAFIFKKFVIENDSTIVRKFFEAIEEEKSNLGRTNRAPGKKL